MVRFFSLGCYEFTFEVKAVERTGGRTGGRKKGGRESCFHLRRGFNGQVGAAMGCVFTQKIVALRQDLAKLGKFIIPSICYEPSSPSCCSKSIFRFLLADNFQDSEDNGGRLRLIREQ